LDKETEESAILFLPFFKNAHTLRSPGEGQAGEAFETRFFLLASIDLVSEQKSTFGNNKKASPLLKKIGKDDWKLHKPRPSNGSPEEEEEAEPRPSCSKSLLG
jgi:hypothetical protein